MSCRIELEFYVQNVFISANSILINMPCSRPVLLKEAALDSPTFRSTTVHFSEQIDVIERWLEGYIRTATKLASELSALELLSGSFLSHVSSPIAASEAVLDHDYTLLALKRYGDSSKDFWSGILSTLRKTESTLAEPIRAFMLNDLRSFKVSYPTPKT